VSQPAWFVGTDGSLWRLPIDTTSRCQQVPSPGDLARVAVSSGSVWCVDTRGVLWALRDGAWSAVPVFSDKVKDVSVAPDRTVYVVTTNGRYYSILPGARPFYHGVFLIVEAICGTGRPDDANPFGRAWGVSPTFGSGALAHCGTTNGWSSTNIVDVADLSVADDGTLWLVKTNGTIWVTRDGGVTQSREGGERATRIAGGFSGLAWAVSSDGSGWAFDDVSDSTAPAPLPPPPPPPPPPPEGSAPTIGVSAAGGGSSTVFTVSGSRFVPNVQVTIRGARIGDGEIHQFYWTATSDGGGRLGMDLPLPCVPGVVISFSANDGRHNPADLTDRLWSNTVQASCPPG
jgi:hypothetical protein